jgi:hypothetical protein
MSVEFVRLIFSVAFERFDMTSGGDVADAFGTIGVAMGLSVVFGDGGNTPSECVASAICVIFAVAFEDVGIASTFLIAVPCSFNSLSKCSIFLPRIRSCP